ncbi:MAG: phosphoribosylformylglycinamidine cyclo-ligase [Proteobacteria bacterium]|nr:phosphoribosylformylglycinamidine cyclo-ligase [Pseudomonadota bacterium]
MERKLSYKDSGVDIDVANQAKREMARSLETGDPRVLNKMGAFSSLYDIGFTEYDHPVLVLKTEEPGSKQLLAFRYDKIESVCFDMINHLVNDCIVMGARPLSVQDAIICGKLEKEKVTRIVTALSKACRQQECVLTGGETSEQPGVLEEGSIILTSSIVGIVNKNAVIDGSNIGKDDVVIGVQSSGLHTNGYTLVRRLMELQPEIVDRSVDGRSFLESILEPHRCYYRTVKSLFGRNLIKGMAHITGGGTGENLNRILPEDVDAEIDLAKYRPSPIFGFIRDHGHIGDTEMLRTFNLGVGLAIVSDKKDSRTIMNHIQSRNVDCYEIGRIVEGDGNVGFVDNIRY